MTKLLSGADLAAGIRADVKRQVVELKEHHIAPTLGIILATGDESAIWYVNSIKKAASSAGIAVQIHDLGSRASADELVAGVSRLADNSAVHGIIIQTPLPKGISIGDLSLRLPASKDIDGAGPLSAGRVTLGEPAFAPSTAEAVMELLHEYQVPLDGTHSLVVGRSSVVGKPVAQLLLQANATVTIAHSHTADVPSLARQADIVVVAIGKPGLIDSAYIKPGAIIIDVGTNPDAHGRLLGDVDAASVDGIAGALTPVPGGVGPVTTAILLRHVVEAAKRT
jgi:methylenetetrahydrofolate dehydrogenase (NADP+) / methenyltetrahydrofolate cyclohydrolase